MNKTPRLSKSGIEYGDYVWNFASGCDNRVSGKCKSGGFKCWAYSLSQRFEDHYPNGFEPTIYSEALLSPLYLKKPSRILCAFMGDLFWDCPEFNPDRSIEVKMTSGLVDHNTLKGWVFDAIEYCPQHTFLFLTKQPQNLAKWGKFPDNCWVGVSVCNDKMLDVAVDKLEDIQATHKFFSFEPLQERLTLSLDYALYYSGISWVILGSQTKPYKPPKIEWVREIVEACDKAGVAVFLKDNLLELVNYQSPETAFAFDKEGYYRQELPSAG